MADVRAIKQAIIADTAPAYNPTTGTVSAYTIVDAIGFNGVKNFKRVRIGVEYGVSVETAKMMMQELRKANDNAPNITGKFVMEL
jgi:hypothetical protein